MNDLSVIVESLSKQYMLGQAFDRHATLREAIIGALARPFKKTGGVERRSQQPEYFWALKNISFEIRTGEIVGIIGANGAGKTTLLKILSRITSPTSGAVHYKGRIASLLEVGTGFHPELSGRENIFVNGAILGMSRLDILERFDEIVEFAGVEKFLDTPVKRYSSGMYVRLAFAVAAHMDPDILIVDEVLAVGDADFQKKCLGRMQSIAERGNKTVFFVSHNLDAIQRICSEAMYLKEGGLVFHGDVKSAIETYLARGSTIVNSLDLSSVSERWGTGRARIVAFNLKDEVGHMVKVLQAGRQYTFEISYMLHDDSQLSAKAIANIEFSDEKGNTVLLLSSGYLHGETLECHKTGTFVCALEDFNLAAGDFQLTLYLGNKDGETFDCLNTVVTVTVAGGDYFGTGHPGFPSHCKTLTRSNWSSVE